MDLALTSIVSLHVAIVAILLAAWHYFDRIRVERPPVGVFNMRDIAFTFVVLVAIPPLYLLLPMWLVGTILTLIGIGLSYLTVGPALGRPAALLVAGGLAAAELALLASGHGRSTGFVVLNDVVVGLLVVGACNILAQSGIRARDVAVFACAVGGFDLTATWLLPLMMDFFTRVRSLPFAPMLTSGSGSDAGVIGMGDLLFIVLWPLVAKKAFSARAGLMAAAVPVSCVMALGYAVHTGMIHVAMPAMVFLGPVILVQYVLFRHRYGVERTTSEYEAATRATAPIPTRPTPPASDLTAALALHRSGDDRSGRYLAVHDGVVIASGSTPGTVTMAARKADPTAIPVLVMCGCR